MGRTNVKGWAAKSNPLLVSAFGAVLAVFAGLLLYCTPMGDTWTNASYDYLFRFGSRAVTNHVTLILMDNSAFASFGQTRGQPWDRSLHARLLNRLADDGCPLVVLDSLLRSLHDPKSDDALATAIRRQKHIVLMAGQNSETDSGVAQVNPEWPADKFLAACGTNSGVAWFSADLDKIVREQWPFPSPEPIPSLPWVTAEQAGEKLGGQPQERWLRYYGPSGQWQHLSYGSALTKPANYFRDQIVFIGNWPETTMPDLEQDKFFTPYTSWTGEATGGVELLATAFLNLLNDDSLLRPARGIELGLLVAAGLLLGGGLCRLRFMPALGLGAGAALAMSLAAILLSYYTDYWFPWLIIVGGQVPCALGWALITGLRRVAPGTGPIPNTPGYKLIRPIGEGAYGKVWLARTKAGAWRALKVVNLANFPDDPTPYEREFNGVKKYQPISDQHPGLLRVDFVSEKLAGCFFYAMELADSLEPGWEKDPARYKPRDLVGERAHLHKHRLPVKDCLGVGITLSAALGFLHRQGMTHRDVKPQNVIFINGQPKIADVGLVTGIRPANEERTEVGTRGYMPPPPERPGTVAADIYALGMMLYVLSTGRPVGLFPEIATTLVRTEEPPEFLPLNEVITKACQPKPEDRYGTADEMRVALEKAQTICEGKYQTKNPDGN